jgi:LuxR family maltose regulon positive regulatory protein
VPAVRSLDIALACAWLEQDDLSGAEAALTHALALSGWAPWVELPGWLALARLRGMQGDEQGLRSVLETLERFGPNVAVLAQGLRILNQLSDSPTGRETLAEACTWTGRIKPDRATRPPMGIKPSSYVVGYATYLVWAHLKVMLGEAHAALEFVEPALAVALQQNLLTRVIELSIVQALAHNILGESRQSREALERALAVAEQCGHVRTFDRGEQLKSLLAEAADRGHRRAQIGYILNAIGWPDGRAAPGKESASPSPSPCASIGKAVGQPRQVAAMLIEPISEREQEVLELIAAGLSNAEVAARLYIGIGTVKTHVNHLFGKLDASSRTQLLAKARLAGLLVEPRS